ncbi:TlpA disulfide reductase family protein [Paraflavitalea sp. CAU 1676]|uniref:TlpA disulfide reductase family protein n=1 Tax=Paraflavitalea sp. CAU 1676 TaxID=3032598 RepID=UPI0023DAD338|nr:TlpA disulfide reductase family protein [Paraflavitalea sp. CAU 1676]MDF2191410.1 TlpA disulfide reductase family protein [Paraflavitalea sp. CAU 1676]
MNRHIAAITQITLCTLIGAAALGQQKKTTGYTITGHVKGLADQKVYISHYLDGGQILDSTESKNGAFVLKGVSPGAYWHYVRAEKYRGGFPLFVENTTITVETDTTFKDPQVTGSATHIQYKEFAAIFQMIHEKAASPHYKFIEFEKTKDSAVYRQAKKEWDEVGQEADSLFTEFVRRNPSSPVAAFAIQDRFVNYNNPMKIEECYKLLKPGALNSTYGKQITEYRKIAALTAIGVKPSFTVVDTTGKKVSLKNFKGQYVLVDFWASWCGPCRKENPNIVKAYQKYHDKGFEVVAISLDDKRAAWIKAIQTDKLPWIHLSDLQAWKSDLVMQYGIKSIPTSFLVDKDGKIIAKNLRGKDLEDTLAGLLQ